MTPPDFRSDNLAPVAPEILAALEACNRRYVGAAGLESLAAEVDRRFSDLFGRPAEVLPVATGTAANAIGLALLAGPGEAIACHDEAHIVVGFEQGAVPFVSGGAALESAAGAHARIDPASLAARLDPMPAGAPRWRALSLTQATEAGTLYTAAQLEALADVARHHDLSIHMDGARLANAVAASGGDAAAMIAAGRVDVLSFGLTKLGGMSADAVILFGRRTDDAARALHKRTGHTLAKRQFQLAQLLAAIEDGLWLRLARHANAMAQRLGAGLAALAGVQLVHPVETNQVFAALPTSIVAPLAAARYQPRLWQGPDVYRFVCAFHHQPAEIDALLRCAAGAPAN